ncbi:unnamed protein product [Orchesella dallaii]|uniref:Uncharacterized protein n=1 Tax=Orchesella dallaii TaxID=48710 RepID=A0ABP1QR69_9HEXA
MGTNWFYIFVIFLATQQLATSAPYRPDKREIEKKDGVADKLPQLVNSVDKIAVKGDTLKEEKVKEKNKDEVAAGSSLRDDEEFYVEKGFGGGDKKGDDDVEAKVEAIKLNDEPKKDETVDDMETECKSVRCSPAPAEHDCKVLEEVPDNLAALNGGCCPIHDCLRADGSTFLHYAFEVEVTEATTLPTLVESRPVPNANVGDLFNPFYVPPLKQDTAILFQRTQRPFRGPPQQGFNPFSGSPVPPPLFPSLFPLARQQLPNFPRGGPQFFNPAGPAPFGQPPFQNRFFPQLSPPQISPFNGPDGIDSSFRFSRNAAPNPNPGPFAPGPVFSDPNNRGNQEGGFREKRNMEYNESKVPFGQGSFSGQGIYY